MMSKFNVGDFVRVKTDAQGYSFKGDDYDTGVVTDVLFEYEDLLVVSLDGIKDSFSRNGWVYYKENAELIKVRNTKTARIVNPTWEISEDKK